MTVQGFRSTWLPASQEHNTGRPAHFDLLRGDLHRGPMWTDSGVAGDLLSSPWQELPSGDYCAILQSWHNSAEGLPVGALLAENESGQTLSQVPVTTGAHEFGDWQRDLVRFRLEATTRVRIRLRYDGRVPIWTGVLQITRSSPRPIHIVGHNRNTPAAIDRSLAAGATSIEGDLSYRNGKLMVAEPPPYPGWTETSEPSAWLAHLQSRRQDWGFIYFDCKLANVPANDYYRFGQELCGLIGNAGIEPERCLFSIADGSGVALFRAVAESGYGASAIGMDGLNGGNPNHVPSEFWSDRARLYQLQCIGLGRAALQFTLPVALWLPVLENAVSVRDSGAQWPSKVLFWTLKAKGGMRKVLDMGVDAVIAEREDHLCEVLLESPYRAVCRRARPDDRSLITAHGISAAEAAPRTRTQGA